MSRGFSDGVRRAMTSSSHEALWPPLALVSSSMSMQRRRVTFRGILSSGVTLSRLVVAALQSTEAFIVGADAFLVNVKASFLASMRRVDDSGTESNEFILNFEEEFEPDDSIVLFLVDRDWFVKAVVILDSVESLFLFSAKQDMPDTRKELGWEWSDTADSGTDSIVAIVFVLLSDAKLVLEELLEFSVNFDRLIATLLTMLGGTEVLLLLSVKRDIADSTMGFAEGRSAVDSRLISKASCFFEPTTVLLFDGTGVLLFLVNMKS